MRRLSLLALLLLPALLVGSAQARTAPDVAHGFFHVQLAGDETPTSGRLLLFAMDAKAAAAEARKQSDGHSDKVGEVDANPFRATETSVAAREVSHWVPGQVVDIDTDGLASPANWSQLPAGDYVVQAVLDVNHDYNYTGRGAGDIVSDVVTVHLPAAGASAAMPLITLDHSLPAHDPWQLPESASAAARKAREQARQHATLIDFVSPSLSAFWGRPIHMRGWALTPRGYDAKAKTRYPVVYYTQGFGGNNDRVMGPLTEVDAAMVDGQMPPMIWVFLDESSPTGTHEFADSVNNGPWGQAHHRIDSES